MTDEQKAFAILINVVFGIAQRNGMNERMKNDLLTAAKLMGLDIEMLLAVAREEIPGTEANVDYGIHGDVDES